MTLQCVRGTRRMVCVEWCAVRGARRMVCVYVCGVSCCCVLPYSRSLWIFLDLLQLGCQYGVVGDGEIIFFAGTIVDDGERIGGWGTTRNNTGQHRTWEKPKDKTHHAHRRGWEHNMEVIRQQLAIQRNTSCCPRAMRRLDPMPCVCLCVYGTLLLLVLLQLWHWVRVVPPHAPDERMPDQT